MMNLWLNNDVNKGTKKVGLRLMVEVLPKLTRQTITHLGPIHKEAMKVKKAPPTNPTPSLPPAPATTSHDINKAMSVVGVVLLIGL